MMTNDEAINLLAIHAGRNEECFDQGYCFKLRYGIKDEEAIEDLFDEIFACLKCLKDLFYNEQIDRHIIADLHSILAQSILYINLNKAYVERISIYTEVLSETLVYLLENAEQPFEAYDHYKENYDLE